MNTITTHIGTFRSWLGWLGRMIARGEQGFFTGLTVSVLGVAVMVSALQMYAKTHPDQASEINTVISILRNPKQAIEQQFWGPLSAQMDAGMAQEHESLVQLHQSLQQLRAETPAITDAGH